MIRETEIASFFSFFFCIIPELESGSSEAISHPLHLVFSRVNNSTRSHLQWLIKKEQLCLKSIVITQCLLNGILLWGVVVIDSSIAAIFQFSLHLQTGEAVSWWKHFFSWLSLGTVSLPRLIAGWASTKPESFRLYALTYFFLMPPCWQ